MFFLKQALVKTGLNFFYACLVISLFDLIELLFYLLC